MQSFFVTALIGVIHAVQLEMLQDSTQTLDKVLAQTGLETESNTSIAREYKYKGCFGDEANRVIPNFLGHLGSVNACK